MDGLSMEIWYEGPAVPDSLFIDATTIEEEFDIDEDWIDDSDYMQQYLFFKPNMYNDR